MQLRALLRTIREYPVVTVIVAVLVIAGGMFAMETSQVLPLEGQATPAYGAISRPSHRVTVKKAVKKPSQTADRRAKRKTLRGAAPADTSSASSVDDACAKYLASKECDPALQSCARVRRPAGCR